MTFWNGFSGAVSLTFDDGIKEQLDHAIPALERRGLRGTFFAITQPETTLGVASVTQKKPYDTHFRTDEWKRAVAQGHEIGGHTVTHRTPDTSRACPERAYLEIVECQKFLSDVAGKPVTSFAYPFTYIDDNLKTAAKSCFKQARGLSDHRGEDKYIRPGDELDMFDIPSIQVNFKNISKVGEWARTAATRGAWVTLMFHGVGPNAACYDNVTTGAFDFALEQFRHQDVWVAPFGEVADKFRESL